MGVRWYNPRIGRWISPDPIIPGFANSQSFNRYSYVLNNPVVYRDTSGYCAEGGSLGGPCIDPGNEMRVQNRPWWKDPAVEALSFLRDLATGPTRLVEGVSTGIANVGNEQYALHPHTVSLLFEASARAWIPNGAMTVEEAAPLPGESAYNARGLKNTGRWLLNTTDAALDTYTVVAPVSYGATNAIATTLPSAGTATGGSALQFTDTTLKRQLDPNRRVPHSMLEAAIQYGKSGPDPQGVAGAVRYEIEMYRNSTAYTLEVVYQPSTNTVLHFLYHR